MSDEVDIYHFRHIGILNTDPLVLMSCLDSFAPFGNNLATGLSAHLKRPYTLLLQVWGSIESAKERHPDHLFEISRTIKENEIVDPSCRIVLLCNTQAELAICREFLIDAIHVNHNCFVDERKFHPLGVHRKFDAIYNAQPWDIKRHELAQEIESLAIIYSLHQGERALHRLQEIKSLIPKIYMFNGDATDDGQFRLLSASDVNMAYNQCHVGLCLSATEGAMFSSIEYLLSGIKVLTTPNLGGRDEFFQRPWCKWVDADPTSVAREVAALKLLEIDPMAIRRGTLIMMSQHRRRLVRYVQMLCNAQGGRNCLRWNFSSITANWAGLPLKSINELLDKLYTVEMNKASRVLGRKYT